MDEQVQMAFDFRDSQIVTHGIEGIPIDSAFPEEAANKLASIESYNKHLYRPNTYLHKWWARRSGTTFRYILKQLISDSIKRDYYHAGGLEGKIILDPMMGGGTTLHEAIRLGANVVGIDIDPIPVLQAKASLNLLPLRQKKAVFGQFLTMLKRELSPLFRTVCPFCENEAEIQFVLYGLRRKCRCREVLFVDEFTLRQDNHFDLRICPECQILLSDLNHECQNYADRVLIKKGTKHCEKCNAPFVDIMNEPFSERYVPLVISGTCFKHDRFFKTLTKDDLALIAQARVLSRTLNFGQSEDFRIPRGPKSDDLLNRGVKTFQELFTPRQLIYLNLSFNFLSQLSDLDRLWLALLVSTSLEFNSLLCGYKGRDIRRPGAIRHVFSHHAYSFPYTALENNPAFSGKTSGTLNRLFNDRILKGSLWAVQPIEIRNIGNRREKVPINSEIDGGKSVSNWKALSEGKRNFLIFRGDSSKIDVPNGIVDYVVTDPPYYDNVQYSDLSAFFRVWLRLFLPQEADWGYNPSASAVSEGNFTGSCKYGQILGDIWKMCARALKKENGRLIFTFHHWRHEAWSELTLSLKRAGLVLVNRYVVFSENPISVHILGLKSLKHDTILILKPTNASDEFRKWQKPLQINITDSYTFCHDCGTAVGWFLSSNISEECVRSEWKRLFEGKCNGKTSS
ncbi:MAG: hypothetical protein JRG73_15100 [Deltaproteobacteria bacterium]|nr:hypothetical protein [Deltaproteobacteria bacterium]MBW2308252.1 hypothetical protein [Deltaproteobacteria bacterium]